MIFLRSLVLVAVAIAALPPLGVHCWISCQRIENGNGTISQSASRG
jgi:hypothetical protein